MEGVDKTVKEEIAGALAGAKKAALPTEADLMTDVYVRY